MTSKSPHRDPILLQECASVWAKNKPFSDPEITLIFDRK